MYFCVFCLVHQIYITYLYNWTSIYGIVWICLTDLLFFFSKKFYEKKIQIGHGGVEAAERVVVEVYCDNKAQQAEIDIWDFLLLGLGESINHNNQWIRHHRFENFFAILSEHSYIYLFQKRSAFKFIVNEEQQKIFIPQGHQNINNICWIYYILRSMNLSYVVSSKSYFNWWT